MKGVIILIGLIGVLAFWPESDGDSQSVNKDQKIKNAVQIFNRATDTIDSVYRRNNQVTVHDTVYIEKPVHGRHTVRTRYVPVHDTIVIHDTIADIGTKYVAVPTREYYNTYIRQYNDSLKADRHKPTARQERRKKRKLRRKHKFLFF